MVNSEIGHFIGGTRVPGDRARGQDIFNPASGLVTERVALASAQEVDRAVAAVRDAFPSWANMPPTRRTRLMNRFPGLPNKHKAELARAITRKHGKIFSDACSEEGVRFSARQKSIMPRWLESIAKGAEFVMPVAR